MKIPEKDLLKVVSTLKKIYSEFHPKGMKSVYLWGTVLTNEYHPDKSDVDSIAIMDDDSLLSESEVRARIKQLASGIKDFKINFLYLGELNGGEVKSKLASVISPSLLLMDFKSWQNVIGTEYSRDDFEAEEIDYDEAIRLNLANIRENLFPPFKAGDFRVTQYIIKHLIRICYDLNRKESGDHEFRYSELLNKSPKERKDIVELLIKIRNSGYDEKLTKKKLPILKDFMNGLGY